VRKFLSWGILAGLSVFFLFAGGSKLLDIPAFTQSVAQYRLVSGQWAWFAALFFPWLEVILALALWVPALRKAALLQLGGLLLVFQGILVSALIRGLDISCGCLGNSLDGGLFFALARNCLLLFVVFLLWTAFTKRNETARGLHA